MTARELRNILNNANDAQLDSDFTVRLDGEYYSSCDMEIVRSEDDEDCPTDEGELVFIID